MTDPSGDSATNAVQALAPQRLDVVLERQQGGWRRGECPSVESLVANDPALVADSEVLLDLIQNEVFFRKELGETPELADYQQRFPKLAEALRIQWAVEQF